VCVTASIRRAANATAFESASGNGRMEVVVWAGSHRPLVSRRADMRSVFIEPMPAQCDALRKILGENEFAILSDGAFTGALSLLLTESPRPPVFVWGVGPLTLSSADTPPFGTGWQPRPGVNYQPVNWLIHRVFVADIQATLDNRLRSFLLPIRRSSSSIGRCLLNGYCSSRRRACSIGAATWRIGVRRLISNVLTSIFACPRRRHRWHWYWPYSTAGPARSFFTDIK
jgi:hypothetical protein